MKAKGVKICSILLCILLLCTVFCACSKGNDHPTEELYVDQSSTVGSSGNNDSGADGTNPGAASGEYEPKIVRTARVTAETKHFDEAVAYVQTKTAELGGYAETSSVQGSREQVKNSYRQANFVLRIPAEQMDAFLSTAGTMLNVTNLETAERDISGTYYDTQARLEVLETERKLLSDMLAKAEKLEDMILLEERLYEVIEEIEAQKTQLKLYDSQVSYSTVTLSLQEVADLTVLAEDNSFGARFQKAAKEGWLDFADGCKDFAIDLMYALPGILLFLILAGGATAVVIVTVKRGRRKKKEKQQEQQEQ